jgi:NhaP-type Na+/H+ and K+/H+ antiporter
MSKTNPLNPITITGWLIGLILLLIIRPVIWLIQIIIKTAKNGKENLHTNDFGSISEIPPQGR